MTRTGRRWTRYSGGVTITIAEVEAKKGEKRAFAVKVAKRAFESQVRVVIGKRSPNACAGGLCADESAVISRVARVAILAALQGEFSKRTEDWQDTDFAWIPAIRTTKLPRAPAQARAPR